MNQILLTEDLNFASRQFYKEKKDMKKKTEYKKLFLKIQLILSVFSICIFSLYLINNFYSMKSDESKSKQLLENYNISKLYNSQVLPNNNSLIIGMIEIKKLEITYPILSNSTDELLKISPCRFYGPEPNEYGNICIAGHNYEDGKFFSKLGTLKNGDNIYIYDSNGDSLTYKVYAVYETPMDDMDCIKQITNVKEVTLVTCNNVNGNRIIVKAQVP